MTRRCDVTCKDWIWGDLLSHMKLFKFFDCPCLQQHSDLKPDVPRTDCIAWKYLAVKQWDRRTHTHSYCCHENMTTKSADRHNFVVWLQKPSAELCDGSNDKLYTVKDTVYLYHWKRQKVAKLQQKCGRKSSILIVLLHTLVSAT